MLDRKLYAVADGTLTELADLAGVSTDRCNDMIVSPGGHAYVGDYPISPGKDAFERLANSAPSNLILVDFSYDPAHPPVSVAARDLLVPNGLALTEDGRTLIVAETGGYRLTAFTVAADGALSDRRIWANLDIAPDGICLDAEGCLWVGTPYPPAVFQRVAEGGRVVETVDPDGRGAFACVLGGDDRRTLFLMESAFPPQPGMREGRVRSIIAPAAGAGLP
jgi:sugar lactone lactonase YvrE